MQRGQQRSEGLFIHGLRGAGQVLVSLFERFTGLARGTQERFQLGAEDGADFGRAIVPCVVDVLAVVAEEFEAEAEGAVGLDADDLPHLVHVGGLAVGGEAHDFVFVAVVGEADELRDCRVEKAQRVREVNAPINLDVATAPHAPRGAGEVPEAVHRETHRLVEIADVKSGREMREMVFDVVELCAKRFARERGSQ